MYRVVDIEIASLCFDLVRLAHYQPLNNHVRNDNFINQELPGGYTEKLCKPAWGREKLWKDSEKTWKEYSILWKDTGKTWKDSQNAWKGYLPTWKGCSIAGRRT